MTGVWTQNGGRCFDTKWWTLKVLHKSPNIEAPHPRRTENSRTILPQQSVTLPSALFLVMGKEHLGEEGRYGKKKVSDTSRNFTAHNGREVGKNVIKIN